MSFPYRYIDTHAHLNLPAFADDREAAIAACAKEQVAVINIGTTAETSQLARDMATAHDHLYAMVGLHPIQAVAGEDGSGESWTGEEFAPELFRELAASSDKVVGIGECGFDYYHTDPNSYETQEAAFIAQIKLANELDLPLMIHTRGPQPGKESPTGRSVYQDVYEVLRQYARVPGNVHFYAGTYEEAKRFFELGFSISFTGVITFAKEYEVVVKAAPLELLHAETDSPFVAPVPYRGRRCDPWMVQSVYQKIATIRGEDEDMVREQLLANAQRCYRL